LFAFAPGRAASTEAAMLELFNHPLPSMFVEDLELTKLRERECGFLPPGARTRPGRVRLVLLVLLVALFVS
jgi:hypothetical protein